MAAVTAEERLFVTGATLLKTPSRCSVSWNPTGSEGDDADVEDEVDGTRGEDESSDTE